MKLCNSYHFEYANYYRHLYCYIHNILADVSVGLPHVFLVKLRSPHGTCLRTVYLIHGGQIVLIPLTITEYKC